MATNKNPHDPISSEDVKAIKADIYDGGKPNPFLMDEVGLWPMARPIDANFVSWKNMPIMTKPEDETNNSKGGK